MQIVIKKQNEVKNVGDAYVVNNPNYLYSDNLIIKGADGVYVLCGSYDVDKNTFDALDTERNCYFVGDDKEFSYEKLMDLVENDEDLGNYANEVSITIEQ